MGKALMIRDVDFSANKLDTVNLDYDIPCIALAISQSTLSLNKVGSTATLTATPTPQFTTDTITWTSSDTDVVTVVGGVVTQTGVGTATVTVSCGLCSATCTVTCVAVYTESDLAVEDGYGLIRYSSSTDAMKAQAANTYAGYALSNNATGGYQAVYNGSTLLGHQVYPIPIPKGAESLEITFPDDTKTHLNGMYIFWLDSKTNQTAVSGVDAAKYIGAVELTNSSTPSMTTLTSYTYDMDNAPAGADSFVINFRGASNSYTPSTWNSSLVLEFT